MSGPQNCSMCMTKFGFFKKQYDCARCHCAICKDCLSAKIPGKDPNLVNVCPKCCKVQLQPKNSGRVSPPANFKREMAKKQEARNDPPQETAADAALRLRLQELKESREKGGIGRQEDTSVDELERRLRKLTNDPKDNVTFEELQYRLAKLKGSRPPAIRVHSLRRASTNNEASSSKSEPGFVEAKKLIRQYTEEIAMETEEPMDDSDFSQYRAPDDATADDLIKLAQMEIDKAKEGIKSEQMEEDEIRKRLSQLDDIPQNTNIPSDEQPGTSQIDFLDEEIDTESAALIQRLMEEDRLEQNLRNSGINLPQKKLTRQSELEAMNDEFPWCFMCNDDATTRCLTCDRELFCKTCFRVVHKEMGMKGHKTEKFVSKDRSDDYV